MPIAFDSLRLVRQSGIDQSPRLVRVDDRNRIVEELRRITVVNVTLSDSEGAPVILPVLALEDEPGDLVGGSGGGAARFFRIQLTQTSDFVDMSSAVTDIEDFYAAESLTPAHGDILSCYKNSSSGFLHFMVGPTTDAIGTSMVNSNVSPSFTVGASSYVAIQIGPNWFF